MHTPLRQWNTRHWAFDLGAMLIGGLLPLSFAPFYLWPLGILAGTLLALLLRGLTKWRGFVRGFFFGVGLYGVGASWVFRSIYDFGFANLMLALILTALFVLGMALVFALPFYIYGRYFGHSPRIHARAFVCLWVLGEWSRSWLLTGFPWLFVGYAHVETWLAGWAPLTGIYGLSFFALSSGVLLAKVFEAGYFRTRHARDALMFPARVAWPTAALATFWLGGLVLSQTQWTHQQAAEPLRVAIVQPNIPQHYKWDPQYYPYIMQTMRDLSSDAWNRADLMLWPENAVPLFYHKAQAYLDEMSLRAEVSETALITGILYDAGEPRTWYNAIIGLGEAEGTYFKQRLVPFGEYVPLEDWLRGTLRFFNLPHSVISAGESGQAPLTIGEVALASSICYEVVYPDLVAEYAGKAGLMLTISNDAWFGDSIGPVQHFQMARMRALENGKYMLRATNNGISGVISHKGEVLATLPHFEQGTLLQEVHLMQGQTPYSRWRSIPIIALLIITFTILLYNNGKSLANRFH